MSSLQPEWVDRGAYPFESRYMNTQHGRLHYVDEGRGPVLLMLHGNPTWSFEFRHLIRGLRDEFRCVAVDHLGFGLSDKPYEVEYTPALHAANVAALARALDLRDITLVVHDWGGPIGLSYAVGQPANVRAVVMSNTWCWPVGTLDFYYQGFSRFMGGPIGRYLIRNHNFFVDVVLPKAVANKAALTPEAMFHYRSPFAIPEDRKASWCFPRQIVAAAPWIGQIWDKRELFRDLPFLVLWGERDIAFRARELGVWERTLRNCRVERFANVGHSIAEEKPDAAIASIRRFFAARGA